MENFVIYLKGTGECIELKPNGLNILVDNENK